MQLGWSRVCGQWAVGLQEKKGPDTVSPRFFTRRRTFSPKVWNDAYLAAFAKASGFDVVTFDKGLAQFKGVRCTILS